MARNGSGSQIITDVDEYIKKSDGNKGVAPAQDNTANEYMVDKYP